MMTKLSPKAHAIMEAYYDIDTTEEEGIVALLREVVNQLQYYNFGEGEDMIVDARAILDIADELEENLK
jgi:hypothetical protein